MFLYCKECSYDSGDADDIYKLATLVKEDGGKFYVNELVNLYYCECPSGHFGEDISID